MIPLDRDAIPSWLSHGPAVSLSNWCQMLIAATLIFALYVAPLLFIVNRIRRDLQEKQIDQELAVMLFSVSLIPFVGLIGVIVIWYSSHDIPSPTELWSRFVLWILS